MKPVLQSLLLADRIYEDKSTGKKIIAGIFSKLYFIKKIETSQVVTEDGGERQVFPGGMHAGSPYAYISLTDIRGKVHCVLRFVALDDNKPLIQCNFEIESKDPLATAEIIVPMPPLPTSIAGVYALELLCNDEPIGALRIIVEELSVEGNESNDDR